VATLPVPVRRSDRPVDDDRRVRSQVELPRSRYRGHADRPAHDTDPGDGGVLVHGQLGRLAVSLLVLTGGTAAHCRPGELRCARSPFQ
jgi:hypothetical protein